MTIDKYPFTSMLLNPFFMSILRADRVLQSEFYSSPNYKHIMKSSQPRRETSWGSEFGWVPGRQRNGVLCAAAPDNGCWFGPQLHVWDSRFVAGLG